MAIYDADGRFVNDTRVECADGFVRVRMRSSEDVFQ